MSADPLSDPQPDFQDLPSLLAAHARQRPDAIALREGAHTLSHRGLDERMDRVAATLQQKGFKPGDTLAICAVSSTDYLVLFMGALRAGLAVAPLAPSSTAAQLVAMDEPAQTASVSPGLKPVCCSVAATRSMRSSRPR